MNLAHWLTRAALARPDAPALMHGAAVTATYRHFAARALGLAGFLKTRGILPGDRVALVSTNRPDYLEALFGIWAAGAMAVPANAKLHPKEIGFILEHSGAKLVLAGPKEAAGLGAVSGSLPVLELGSPEWQAALAHEPATVHPARPEDRAWLFYTSGTTGRPKGATLTHRNLMAMTMAYLSVVDPTGEGDTILHAAPMSHGSGLYAMAHVAALGVNAVAESGGFEAGEIFGFMRARPRTSMFAAPTMIRRLVEAPGDVPGGAIRTIIWGGAPMHVADTIRALDRFGPVFAQIYGQGETPMSGTVLTKAEIADRDHPRWRHRLESAGRASPVCAVRIHTGEGTAGEGETGEIEIAGDTVMEGYWENPQATGEAIVDGWLRTGDVGLLDEEGYLFLKDRSKDVIISGGSNIYPREVEEALLTHPGVLEVSVIGRPDPEWGEIVVACVVGSATRDELDAHLNAAIARFKRPKAYRFMQALPKNAYGKILKRDLREQDPAQET